MIVATVIVIVYFTVVSIVDSLFKNRLKVTLP